MLLNFTKQFKIKKKHSRHRDISKLIDTIRSNRKHFNKNVLI